MFEESSLPLKASFAGAITQVNLVRPNKLRKAISQPPKPQYHPFLLLGSGAFGSVYSAYGKNGRVAIKKVKVDPHYINRELEILRMINSPFCLKLIDSFTANCANSDDIYLCIVTDLMPSSLKQYIDNLHNMMMKTNPFMVKLFAFQIFAGLDHIHSLGITHRDIKTDNILVDDQSGSLKICDFGSAKIIEKDGESVSYIASRHFRAPELLLDCTKYGPPIDIWAAGCVIAEVLNDSLPMFLGSSNNDQMVQIMQVLGKPSCDDVNSFQHPLQFPDVNQISNLKNVLPLNIDKDLFQLLSAIFVYNPNKRPTARQCMMSPYFDELFIEGKTLPNGKCLPKLARPI